ncbi:MAG: hypothetical protein M1822_004913 [Bathelium mastoideum]|nr:MAG: hypothetical protein M1822_004913 [Bathelium mastoideum]
MDALLDALGDEVADAAEETFLLYSRVAGQSCESSGNLGFIDPTADELEIHVAGKDLTIRQFPKLLVSNRAEGTTGAVLWKITPPFADWLAARDENALFRYGILGPESTVVELGAGVTGVILLAVAPSVGRYIATDQQYVLQHLGRNIEANVHWFRSHTRQGSRRARPSTKEHVKSPSDTIDWNVQKLDWETDSIVGIPQAKDTSVLLAVDCIYNEALIEPFIRTCADICRFRTEKESSPTVCVIAQQLRSEDVFEAFMESFVRTFRVWRLPESSLSPELRNNAQFVIHMGVLRKIGDSFVADNIYLNSMLEALSST